MKSQKGGTNYDKEIEKENWNHPAFHVKIIETNADNPIISKHTQTEAKAKQGSELVLLYIKTII